MSEWKVTVPDSWDPYVKALGAALAGAGVLAVANAARGDDSRVIVPRDGKSASPYPTTFSGEGWLEGVDVSAAQGPLVDWNAARDDAHLAFMIAKDGQGAPGSPRGFQQDGTFIRNRDQARALLPFWGAYRYVIFTHDPKLTVQSMAKNIEAVNDDRMLPPSFDFEWQYNDGKVAATGAVPVTGSRVIDWMYACAEECKRLLSRRPMVYTSSGWWNSIGDPIDPIQEAYALWVANWSQAAMDGHPSMPKGWKRFALVQYSAEAGPLAAASIKGIPGAGKTGKSVDRDRFRGTLEDMGAFVKASML